MAFKRNKKVIVIVVAVIAISISTAYVLWNKPRRNITDETSIKVSSAQLVKEYQENETAANTKYLDKALEVTGTVTDLSNNQEGKLTVMLASDDAMSGVFCTLKENAAGIKNGSVVTIKGFCSGMLSDVRLREAVLLK